MIFSAILFALASCAGGSITNTGGKAGSALSPNPASAGKYIVVLRQTATSADLGTISNALAARPEFSYRTVFLGFSGALSSAELARLKADPRVAYVEPDLPVYAFGRPSPPPPPETFGWGVTRIHDNPTVGAGGAGVTVAVIDTGIDLDHTDLINSNGSPAVIANYNVFYPTKPAEDDNGHGSHVAGIIGARDNSIGFVGVAPNCSLVAVKVLNRNGSGSISGINAGIDWVASHASPYGIEVANMSLGGSGYSQSMYDAIAAATAAGVTFVVAAGNSDADAGFYFPASYDNVICVSALTKGSSDTSGGSFASYSNWGSAVDILAPGTSVPSLWKGGGYNTISGTSMASPHAAGAAALWLDDHSGGFSEVYSALTGSGESAPGGGWSGDPDGISEPLVNAATL